MKRRILSREAEKAKMLSRQYEWLWQAWSENAMLFHDMENHLQTIYHLAEAGGNEEICSYIARISKPAKQFTGIVWTGGDCGCGAKREEAACKGERI